MKATSNRSQATQVSARRLRAITESECHEAAARQATRAAVDDLDFDTAAVYGYDEDTNALVLLDARPRDETENRHAIEPGEDPIWQAFTQQETTTVREPGETETARPLGNHGVILTTRQTEPAVAGRQVEAVAATLQATFGRIRAEERLKIEDRQNEMQARQLHRVRQLNDGVRRINKAFVGADDPDEILQSTVDILSEIDRFDLVWIGKPNDGVLETTASAGDQESYIDEVLGDADGDPPWRRAVRRNETQVHLNVGDHAPERDWANHALVRGFRSTFSTPVDNDGVIYGVLTVHSYTRDDFDVMTTSVLEELSEQLAYAISCIERCRALETDSPVRMRFRLADVDCNFVDYCRAVEGRLSVDHVTRHDGEAVVNFEADGPKEDELHEAAERHPGVVDVHEVSDDRYQAVVAGRCVPARVLEHGVRLEFFEVDEEGCVFEVAVPADRDTRDVASDIRSELPEAEVTAATSSKPSRQDTEPVDVTDGLTDRQDEVLRTAYRSGYFEDSREMTGAEIAESLGISQPSFSQQLRVGLRKVLETTYGER
ncbi:MAG: GAF domain-containing protein [Halobacteriota archaeon]